MLIQNAFMFRQKTTSIDRLAFQITNFAVESFFITPQITSTILQCDMALP